MGLRLLISRLASADVRRSAARALALLTVAGFILTMIVLAASGRALNLWLFVLLVWALFIYIPLRILLEAAQTLAPALRQRLGAEGHRGARRRAIRPEIELTVDTLLELEVVMPRIATPREAGKARDGASAVLVRAGADDGALRSAAGDCLAAVDRWVSAMARWAERDTGQNIQARWSEVRALAGLAAMTKVLIAAYEDRAAAAFTQGNGPLSDPAGFLDACLDYCDDLALDVEVRRWDEPALGLPLPEVQAEQIHAAWRTYTETGAPALEARMGFVDTLLSPSSRPARPSVS